MKAVIQNVIDAELSVDNKQIARISRGFVIFVGFADGDDAEIIRKMIDKIVNMRVFQDGDGKTNLSILDIKGEILSVSQFTLYADVSNGRRPSFTKALEANKASELFDYFNDSLLDIFGPIQKGIFGADMKVSLLNDGPFTMILDSKELFAK
ncbi:MAG: D-aminoacyl-tRNA deacylase [Bacilli bacterium]|jgi:D-tyrosyl-tRNA(Tyr) deacylase